MNKYIGHPLQLYGVEEIKLCSGKGEGMKMLLVRNACGLEFFISQDRCADISRLTFKGINYSYIAPCGYVSPTYYNDSGNKFLKSFTAGFITTCGLTSVGKPCIDYGEELPMHGTISNTPCENISHWIENDEIHIKAWIRDATLFDRKLILEREYIVPLYKNEILLFDKITNYDWREAPLEIMYHCNMGYPLVSPEAILEIPYETVIPRTENARLGITECLKITEPKTGIEEECFYYTFKKNPEISLFNKKVNKGLKITYNKEQLKFFTQWKMMGEYEYVMGLEPGNCIPDGRDVMRKNGDLELLKPDETKIINIKFEFTEE